MTSLREVMDLVSRPGILSFAIGLPAAELFPREALAEASARVLRDDPSCLQYSVPYRPLKSRIVELMALRGVACSEEQIFLTSGAQQGMDLLSRLLVAPGAEVMTEWAIYDGLQMAVRHQQPRFLAVASDPRTGIDVDEVESRLAGGARPAFLYLIPCGHNPLGATLDLAARQRLAALARRYRLPLLEDDVYGLLHYGAPPPPAVRAFDDEWVYYLGSFSKILAPSLRAGWVVAPADVVARLSPLKHAVDLDTPSLSHRVIAAYLETGGLAAHVEGLRAEYGRRRDAMLAALGEQLPAAVRWSLPTGGMFIWVELPAGLDASGLLRAAVETESVAFSPGAAFCLGEAGDPAGGDPEKGRRCLRLSFTSHPPERIAEGVRRLGRVIREALAAG